MSILEYIIFKDVFSNESYPERLDVWLKKYDKKNYEKGDLAKLFSKDNLLIFINFFNDIEADGNMWYSVEDFANKFDVEYEEGDSEDDVVITIINRLKPTNKELREFKDKKNAVKSNIFVFFNIQLYGKIAPNEKHYEREGCDLILDITSSIEQLQTEFKDFITSEGAVLNSLGDSSEYNLAEIKFRVEYSKVHRTYYGATDYNEQENFKSVSFEIEIEHKKDSGINYKDFFFEYKQKDDITVMANIFSIVGVESGSKHLIKNRFLC